MVDSSVLHRVSSSYDRRPSRYIHARQFASQRGNERNLSPPNIQVWEYLSSEGSDYKKQGTLYQSSAQTKMLGRSYNPDSNSLGLQKRHSSRNASWSISINKFLGTFYRQNFQRASHRVT
jgi:hypothetical protein